MKYLMMLTHCFNGTSFFTWQFYASLEVAKKDRQLRSVMDMGFVSCVILEVKEVG